VLSSATRVKGEKEWDFSVIAQLHSTTVVGGMDRNALTTLRRDGPVTSPRPGTRGNASETLQSLFLGISGSQHVH